MVKSRPRPTQLTGDGVREGLSSRRNYRRYVRSLGVQFGKADLDRFGACDERTHLGFQGVQKRLIFWSDRAGIALQLGNDALQFGDVTGNAGNGVNDGVHAAGNGIERGIDPEGVVGNSGHNFAFKMRQPFKDDAVIVSSQIVQNFGQQLNGVGQPVLPAIFMSGFFHPSQYPVQHFTQWGIYPLTTLQGCDGMSSKR